MSGSDTFGRATGDQGDDVAAAPVQFEFNVFALLREEIESVDGEVDLDEVAARVLGRIPKRHLADAVLQLLPAAAGLQARRTRDSGWLRPALGVVRDSPQPAGEPGSRRWERASGAAAQRAAQLRAGLITVGVHRRKPLADCTAEDLRYAIEMHVRLAEQNTARADAYSRLLEAMQAKGVRKAGKLKDAVLVAALDGSET
jgi:hypothetical protein